MAAIDLAKKGADELDVSMNVGRFKAGDSKMVLEEMKVVVEAAKNIKKAMVVKFIIETGFLNDDEIKEASELVVDSGADFVKTCSGWGPRGAEIKDVQLIKAVVGGKVKIKVAGGIRHYQKAVAFIKAGADRIGTSKAVEIVSGKSLKGGDGE
jgi:deoxyribose-phosphate aldolase